MTKSKWTEKQWGTSSGKYFKIFDPRKEVFRWDNSLGLLVSHDLMIDYVELRDSVNSIRKALGEDLFFDIDDPQHDFRPVPALSFESEIPMSTELSPKESFLYTIVRSPEGEQYSSRSELVGVLATYWYDVVPEVTEYTRDSLNALDVYFSKHPPRHEFNQDFLLSEFIPALDAHLGETLVRSLGGVWDSKSPLLKSCVNIESKGAKGFELTYEAVFEQKRLVDIYDSYSQ